MGKRWLIWFCFTVMIIPSTVSRGSPGNDGNLEPSLVSGRPGAIDPGTVNLATGDVSFSTPLLTLPGRGGLGLDVKITYGSGHVPKQAATWNLEAPTGVVGLGWTLPREQIIRHTQGTGTPVDDTYYVAGSTGMHPLMLVGKEEGTEHYQVSGVFKQWEIHYSRPAEQWVVVRENGIKYFYGGDVRIQADGNKTSTGHGVEWGVKWGNWMGSSTATAGQQQIALVWNLTAMENTWGERFTFKYFQTQQFVGPGGKGRRKHTQASYLESIENSDGARLHFIYAKKEPFEYQDPHTESPEPDAYQERYETRYLQGIDFFNAEGQKVSAAVLGYNESGGFLGNHLTGEQVSLKKRLLTSIIFKNSGGKALAPPHKFEYYRQQDGVHASLADHQLLSEGAYYGALKKVTLPEGASTTFFYSGKEIQNSSRSIQVSSPDTTTWVKPYLQFGPDYVLVTWFSKRGLSSYTKLMIQLYQWESQQWEHKFTTPAFDTVNARNSILTQRHIPKIIPRENFFIVKRITSNTPTKKRSEIDFYHRLSDRTWRGPITLPMKTDSAQITAGDNFAALAGNGKLFRFLLRNQTWWNDRGEPLTQENPGDGIPFNTGETLIRDIGLGGKNDPLYAIEAKGNVLLAASLEKPKGNHVQLQLFYLNADHQWKSGYSQPIPFPIDRIRGMKMLLGNSFLVIRTYSYIRELEKHTYLYRHQALAWDDRFRLFHAQPLQKIETWERRFHGSLPDVGFNVFNNTIAITDNGTNFQRYNKTLYTYRFDGMNFIESIHKTHDNDLFIANDMITTSTGYWFSQKENSHLLMFDANKNKWEPTERFSYTGTHLSYWYDAFSYVQAGSDLLMLAMAIYNPLSLISLGMEDLAVMAIFERVTDLVLRSSLNFEDISLRYLATKEGIRYLRPNGVWTDPMIPVFAGKGEKVTGYNPMTTIEDDYIIYTVGCDPGKGRKMQYKSVVNRIQNGTVGPSIWDSEGSNQDHCRTTAWSDRVAVDREFPMEANNMFASFRPGKEHPEWFGHYIPKGLKEVDAFTLHRMVQDGVAGSMHDVAVTKVVVSDGLATTEMNFQYDTATAAMHPTGVTAVYHQVTAIPGDPQTKLNGYSHHYFYNSAAFSPEETIARCPDSVDCGELLSGMPYKTEVYDADGALVASDRTFYEVIEKAIKTKNQTGPSGKAYLIHPLKTMRTLDETQEIEEMRYDEWGRPFLHYAFQHTPNNDIAITETIMLYGDQRYRQLDELNIRDAVVQTITNLFEGPDLSPDNLERAPGQTQVENTVTTWKNWGSANEPKWASERTYRALKKGAVIFPWSASPPPRDKWLLTSKIMVRDPETGVPLEELDVTELHHSAQFDSKYRFPIATTANASFLAGQTGYLGLEPYENPEGWEWKQAQVGEWDWYYREVTKDVQSKLAHTGTRAIFAPKSYRTVSTLSPKTFSPRPNVPYLVSAWVKGTARSAGKFPCTIGFRTEDENPFQSEESIKVIVGSTWQYVEYLTLNPSSHAKPFVACSGEIYLDDIRFGPVDAPFNATVYDPVLFLPTATMDGNGAVLTTEYDDLYRPKILKNQVTGLLTVFTYSFPALTEFNPSRPPWMQVGMCREDSLSRDRDYCRRSRPETYRVRTFLDGLGRPIQQQTLSHDARTALTTGTIYDGWGHAAIATLVAETPVDPVYRKGFADFDWAAMKMGTKSGVVTYYRDLRTDSAKKNMAREIHNLDNQYPYTQTVHEASPLARPVTRSRPGGLFRLGAEPDFTIKQRHGLADSVSKDEKDSDFAFLQPYFPAIQSWTQPEIRARISAGLDSLPRDHQTRLISRTFMDQAGRTMLRETGNPDLKLTATTTFTPDFGAGGFTQTTTLPNYHVPDIPHGERFLNSHQVNYQGHLTLVSEPDSGETKVRYDRYGRTRMVQDAQNALDGLVQYWKYDALGRVTEAGFFSKAWRTISDAELNDREYPKKPYTWRVRYAYDFDPQNLAGPHLKNRLWRIESNNDDDGLADVIKTLAYDRQGRVIEVGLTVTDYDAKVRITTSPARWKVPRREYSKDGVSLRFEDWGSGLRVRLPL